MFKTKYFILVCIFSRHSTSVTSGGVGPRIGFQADPY